MLKYILHVSLTAMLLLMSFTNFAQAPNLGTASSFSVFTAVGAFDNLGPTTIIGDIGTNVGVFTGFPPGVVIGQIHVADAISAQAAADVLAAYSFLQGITCGVVLGTGLGGGQTLAPNVYCLGAASTLNGQLILDAMGDPNALFIFQIDGALTTGLAAQVILINGASVCNVYWQVNGAFSLGENSVFRGTLIANGAISLLENSEVFGRALSTSGAIDLHNNNVEIGLPPICLITGNDVFCAGQSTQLCATPNQSAYLWSTGAISACISVNAPGIFSVTITNENGCTSSCEKSVSASQPPVCQITGNPFFCAGQSTQLCATPNQAAYLWNTGAVSACISVNTPGLFSVTITGLNGCTSSCSQTVLENALPPCQIMGNPAFCAGQSTQLCVPPGASAYLWNTGAMTNCITVITPGLYSVTITELSGCTSTCSQNVIQNPSPVCQITGNPFFCAGQSTQLCATPNQAAYLWNTGAVSACISVNQPGLFSVTITDVNGCTSFCSQNVIQNPSPVCLITGNFFLCAGLSTQLCVAAGAASYLWSNGGTSNCITVNVGGTYSVTITAANGCTSSCSQLVLENALPPCQITGNPSFCAGQSTQLCVPAGAASYLWNTGATTNCITVNTGGLFSVTVTQISGCTSTCSQNVVANPLPVCQITGNPFFCAGQSTQLCATPNQAAYLWNTGAVSACISVNTPGLFSVTITDVNGCTSFCSQNVTGNGLPPCQITGNPTFCAGQSTLLCVPAGSLSYLWNTGATTNCISANTAGLFSVTVTEIGGCTSTCEITVLVGVLPTCIITGTDVICPGQTAQLCTPAGASAYLWNTGATSNCITINAPGTFSVTVTGANGCTSFCLKTVLPDQSQPQITCPGNVSISCTASPLPANTGTATTTANCLPTTVSFIDIIVAGNCPQNRTITRIWTATSANGVTATCVQTITVSDQTAPQIVCPLNVTINCNQPSLPINTGLATATDNCTLNPTVNFTDAITPGICAQTYLISRRWTATDACQNSTFCIQLIQVRDIAAPTITCPPNQNFQCANAVPPANPALILTGDNCSTVIVTTLSEVVSNFICNNRFNLTRTFRATDACGNSATCAQTITVFDNTPPTISFKNPLLINGGTLEVQCFGQNPNWELPTFGPLDINTTDNCGGTPSIVFLKTLEAEGNCPTDGFIVKYRLTWTVTDVCGNTNSAFIFLLLTDNIPPVIVGVPADITVNCSDIPAAPIMVGATDECLCACVTVFTETTLAPGCQNGQFIVRTWTATDACGNISTAQQRITLIDNTGPELVLTGSFPDGTVLNFSCNDGGFPEFLGDFAAQSVVDSSVCGGSFSVNFNQETLVADYCKTAGFMEQRTFTWTANDECGNLSSLTLIARLIDTEKPTLNGVPTMTCIGNPLLNLVEVSDNCGQPSLEFHDLQIPNPCGPGTATRRVYEGWDDCGNVARDTAILLPNSGASPIIKFTNPMLTGMLPGEILTINCSAVGGQFTNFGPADVSVEAACPVGATVVFSEKMLASGDCLADGFVASIQLKWTATDFCGNISSLNLTAHVVDETAPVFPNFQPEITITCGAAMPQTKASDNCGGVTISSKDSVILGNCAFEYTVIRQITASDACGNTTTKQQIIHVGNGNGPTIAGVKPVICDDLSLPVVTAFDACAGKFVPVKMTQDTLVSPCREGFVIERIWTATDSCGNVAESRQIIILHDHTPPKIRLPFGSDIGQFLQKNCTQIQLSQTDLLAKLASLNAASVVVVDDCDESIEAVFQVDSVRAADCLLAGFFERKTYRWIATDVCGNSIQLSFCVEILDNVPPVIVGKFYEDTIACADLPAVPILPATDGQGLVEITFTQTILPGGSVGVFIVTRRWTATDGCGNATVYEQIFVWIPDSFLVCNVVAPPAVECNSHGVMITGSVTGGLGPLTYLWEVVGEKCFIQTGQGTPKITIYIGWSEVKIKLIITDAFGCTTMCMTTLNCYSPAQNPAIVESDAVILTTHFGSETLTSSIFSSPIEIWPNPATEKINLRFESSDETEVEISLADLTGRVVFFQKINTQRGTNEPQLDVSKIPVGGYRLRLKTAAEMQTKGVVILRNN